MRAYGWRQARSEYDLTDCYLVPVIIKSRERQFAKKDIERQVFVSEISKLDDKVKSNIIDQIGEEQFEDIFGSFAVVKDTEKQ